MRTAAPLLFLGAIASCSNGGDAGPAPATPGHCPGVQLLVAASDYSSSVLCGAPGCVQTAGRTTERDFGYDPTLVVSNGHAFYLARDEDLVFPLDPACATPTSSISLDAFKRIDAKGARRNANPHDVAATKDGRLAIVALYSTPRIVFLQDGKIDGEGIDLARYDEYDHNPQAEAVRIVDVGGVAKAFVALERLDDTDPNDPSRVFVSNRPSQMLRIDVATRTPEGTTDLMGRNPFNAMAELEGALFMAMPGDPYVTDEPAAGIERFDTATSTTRLLLTEHDAGGSVMEIAVTSGCGVAIVAGATTVNATALITFHPDTGAVLRSYAAPAFGPTEGFDLQGLAWRGTTLFVGDRRKASNGLYPVHELALSGTCDLADTGRTIDLPEPPVGLQVAIP